MMATNTASEAFNSDPLLGKTVGGRYVIERLIGRGGVGLVYLADDTVDDRKVVVKVLAPHWAEDADAVARFDREALRMAKLDHPNVVEMYDHGHFEGRTYIVMEFIRGEPLRRYLNRRKRMPLEEFVPIASQILQGAGYVHERGIMMRDIKPPNIMLCEQDGRANHVKLLDFGLAKLIEEDEEDEVTKAHVIGTAAYMSPEQIRGEKIDVRVDVYALGVLFFLMLTGEQPIAGDNDAAVLVNHVHGKPKSLAERLPKGHRVPPRLIELIESCLAKDPDDRPSSASEMAEALFEIVPAPLLQQPLATLKTRAAAETYWATRLNSGPAALAALQSDTSDSAEWTRPLLRRAAEAGKAPLELAEAEVAAQREKVQAVPRPRPRTGPRSEAGSGVRPRPRSGPRSEGGSGLMPRPKPPGPPPAPPPRPASGPTSRSAPRPASRPSSAPTTSAANAPTSATIRVTAADAREAVERLEEELEAKRDRELAAVEAERDRELAAIEAEREHALAALDVQRQQALAALDTQRTGKHTTVPPRSPGEPDPDPDPVPDAETSGVVPISLDVDDGPSSEAIAATMPSDLMVGLSTDVPPTDPLGVVTSASFAPPRADGMRLGAIVAVAGLVALALGGLSAFLVLGGSEEPAAPPAVASGAAGDATPAATHSAAVGAAASPTPGAHAGMVEVRATNQAGEAAAGARIEVDGEDRGEAPVQLELPVGEHRVRVTAPGHHPWQTTIVVKPEANADVTAELVPAEGQSPLATPADAGPKRSRTSGGSGGGSGGKKPKAEPKSDPNPDASASEPKLKPKPKPEVFMDSSKGKDDGIFLPVGGK